jgi:hypothetical protein
MVCDRVEQLVHIPAEAVTLGGLLVIPAMAQGMVLFAHGSGSSRHSPRFNIDLLAMRLVAATRCLYTQSRAHDLTLAFFAVVHPCRVVAADPLASAVKMEPLARFMAIEVGVADEPQMGLKIGLGQGLGQPAHARGNAAGPGVGIRALERQHVKLHGHRHRHLLINPDLHGKVARRSAHSHDSIRCRA